MYIVFTFGGDHTPQYGRGYTSGGGGYTSRGGDTQVERGGVHK